MKRLICTLNQAFSSCEFSRIHVIGDTVITVIFQKKFFFSRVNDAQNLCGKSDRMQTIISSNLGTITKNFCSTNRLSFRAIYI